VGLDGMPTSVEVYTRARTMQPSMLMRMLLTAAWFGHSILHYNATQLWNARTIPSGRAYIARAASSRHCLRY
jgi:hypothetical protein